MQRQRQGVADVVQSEIDIDLMDQKQQADVASSNSDNVGNDNHPQQDDECQKKIPTCVKCKRPFQMSKLDISTYSCDTLQQNVAYHSL